MRKELKDALVPVLIQDEGVKYEIYLDHLGYPTFGIGHLITKDDREYGQDVGTPVSEVRVMEAFSEDMDSCLSDAERLCDLYSHPLDVRIVVASMVFQMGLTRVYKFKRFLANLNNSDYDAAAAEMLDSRWARQTPNRVSRLVRRMKNAQ